MKRFVVEYHIVEAFIMKQPCQGGVLCPGGCGGRSAMFVSSSDVCRCARCERL